MSEYLKDIFFGRCPKILEDINGIKFTARHIDILSCLLNGRDLQTIAKLLGIEKGTVESHTENMRQRTGLNARQHLIDFAEQSGKKRNLNEYYFTLCKKYEFDKIIQKISTLEKQKKKILVLNPEDTSISEKNICDVISKHLVKSGLEIIIQKKLTFRKSQNAEILVVMFSKKWFILKKRKSLNQILSYLEEKDLKNSGSVIPVLLDEEVRCNVLQSWE